MKSCTTDSRQHTHHNPKRSIRSGAKKGNNLQALTKETKTKKQEQNFNQPNFTKRKLRKDKHRANSEAAYSAKNRELKPFDSPKQQRPWHQLISSNHHLTQKKSTQHNNLTVEQVLILKAPKILKEAVLTAGGQLISFAGTIVLLKLTTTWLSPAEYGQLALFLTFVNLANKVGTGGAINAASRFYPEASIKQQEDFYFAAIKLLLSQASVWIGVTSIAAALILSTRETSLGAPIIFVGILSISSAIGSSLNAINTAKRERWSSLKYYARTIMLRIFITFSILLFSEPTASHVLLAYCLSASLSMTFELVRFRDQLSNQKNAKQACAGLQLEWNNSIWKFAWPFSVWGAFTWLQEAADKWSLEAFFGANEVGIYAAAYQIGFMPIVLAVGTVNELFSPIINAQSEEPEGRSNNKIIYFICGGWATVIFLAFAATRTYSAEIFNLFASPAFANGANLLPYFILLGGGQAIFSTLNLKLNALKVSKPRLYLNVICACIGAIFIFIGARAGGIQGVLAAMGFTYTIKVIWEIALVRRYTAPKAISNQS